MRADGRANWWNMHGYIHTEIIEDIIKVIRAGKTTEGERESGRNDSGANGKVGETTQGEQALEGKKESERNYPEPL